MSKEITAKPQSHNAEVVACGAKSDNADYPLTVRLENGEYMKVWHDSALKRGTSVTVDLVTWENGWTDKFITTC
jgi:hypothetical protein